MNKDKMTRAAKKPDIEQITLMYRDMCKEVESMGGHEISSDVGHWSKLPDTIKDWISDKEREIVVVISPHESLSGFGTCKSYMLGGAYRPTKTLHVGALYVAPGHRNKGLGKSLLESMLQWGKEQECEACELNVHIDNPAIRLYEKCGFDKLQIQMSRKLGT